MKYFIFIFLFIFPYLSCSENTTKIIVGKFDKGTVNLSEVLYDFNSLTAEEKQTYKTKEDYFRIIRKVALDKIIIYKAIEDGLDKKDDFIKQITDSKKTIAYNLLKTKNVLDKIKIVEADYTKYKKTFELYQIVKRSDILDDKKLKESKDLLNDIRTKIKSLDDFKKNAEKYSDDVTSTDGGFVGNIRFGVMEEEIDKVLNFQAEKKTSEIIETGVGYHIIWINSITETSLNDLLKDKNLYQTIYKQKEDLIENDWYNSLLGNLALSIDKNKLYSSKDENTTIVKYKDKTITLKEINKNVTDLRQGTFPEPTKEELYNLVKNMALKLILEDMMSDKSLLDSDDYKNKVNIDKDFIMKNMYIAEKTIKKEVTDTDIEKYYNDNLSNMFTFKLDDGKTYIQKIDEVKKLITQKLEKKFVQDARYDLYRRLVDEAKLVISDKDIEKVKIEIEKLSKK